MIELFPNVSQTVRDRAKFWVDLAILCPQPDKGAQQLMEFRNTLTDEEKDFFDFYFTTRMAERNESYND